MPLKGCRFEKRGEELQAFLEEPSTRANWGFEREELVIKVRGGDGSYRGQWKVFDTKHNASWTAVELSLHGDELITDPRDETGPHGWMRIPDSAPR